MWVSATKGHPNPHDVLPKDHYCLYISFSVDRFHNTSESAGSTLSKASKSSLYHCSVAQKMKLLVYILVKLGFHGICQWRDNSRISVAFRLSGLWAAAVCECLNCLCSCSRAFCSRERSTGAEVLAIVWSDEIHAATFRWPATDKTATNTGTVEEWRHVCLNTIHEYPI